jgi:Effector Associated Constant Component 1
VELTVEIDLGPDAEAAELDEATRQLREQLLQLDVEDVARPAEAAPADARGVDVAALGTLLVTAGQSAVSAIAGALASWLARRPRRTVKLQIGDDSIELTDASAEEQRQLLAAFLARHGGTET